MRGTLDPLIGGTPVLCWLNIFLLLTLQRIKELEERIETQKRQIKELEEKVKQMNGGGCSWRVQLEGAGGGLAWHL